MTNFQQTLLPQLEALSEALPKLRISTSAADRIAYSRDLWPGGLLELLAGRPDEAPPLGVVWPTDADELMALVAFAREQRLPLVPFGAGSGVCKGAVGGRGSLVVDLKGMDRVLWSSPEDNLARVQTGILGWHLEDALAADGLTLGHFPSSLMCSTLGGYLATRSAGQCSSLYGKIEDMVVSVRVVTGAGQVFETGRDVGPSPGPDWTQLFVGSEGAFGFITEATLRVHPLPELRIYRAYGFPRVAAGCEAIRRLMQCGVRPAVIRLYDEFDSIVARSSAGKGSEADDLLKTLLGRLGGPKAWLKRKALQVALSRPDLTNRLVEELSPHVAATGCLCVVGYEGDARIAQGSFDVGHGELLRAGGKDLGEEPGWHWHRHRYSVSFKQSRIFGAGAFVDTMEVASTWARLMELYDCVRRAASPHAFVMAHFSHAYPEGCSIYFTFVGRQGTPSQTREAYLRLWSESLAAATRAGGTISHHHGVGRAKAGFMREEHGTSLPLLRTLKQTFDPDGILNPGVLGLA
ncbi:MAG: FAD-binding oxidoreductase [Polyangia bacterium]|jgi:alkyldihydroxyacetonephosphate synthase|nr:FAD-binding oxidoreductase [Polyangia bacterium]